MEQKIETGSNFEEVRKYNLKRLKNILSVISIGILIIVIPIISLIISFEEEGLSPGLCKLFFIAGIFTNFILILMAIISCYSQDINRISFKQFIESLFLEHEKEEYFFYLVPCLFYCMSISANSMSRLALILTIIYLIPLVLKFIYHIGGCFFRWHTDEFYEKKIKEIQLEEENKQYTRELFDRINNG